MFEGECGLDGWCLLRHFLDTQRPSHGFDDHLKRVRHDAAGAEDALSGGITLVAAARDEAARQPSGQASVSDVAKAANRTNRHTASRRRTGRLCTMCVSGWLLSRRTMATCASFPEHGVRL